MELSINSKVLLDAVKVVGACVKPKNTMPILDNLLFELSKEKLRITADNLEIRTQIDVPIKSKGELTTCVPYALLVNILSVMENSPISLVFSEEELKVKSKSGTYKLPLVNEPFPEPKQLDEATIVKDSEGEFLYGLKKSLIFVPASDWNNFNNVFFYLDKEGSKMYSGIEAMINECSLPISSEERKLLIPRQVADYIVKTVSPQEELEVGFTDTHLFLKLTDRTIVAILSIGKEHNFGKLVDSIKPKNTLKVDRELLMSAVKKLHSISIDSYGLLIFDILKDKVKISVDDVAKRLGGQEELSCEFDGDSFKIGFRSDYFISAVNAFSEETEISIGLLDSFKPALFTADNLKVVLAPFKINQ